MALYMIGTVSKDFETRVGVRIYDTNTKKVKDCPIGGVAQFINDGNKVENLEIRNGVVVCTNGLFDNYATVILNLGVAGRSPLVIVKQYADDTYEVVNGQGESARMSKQFLMKYERTDGLANAKIAINSDGKLEVLPYTDGAKFEVEKHMADKEKLMRVAQRSALIGNQKFDIANGEFKWLDEADGNIIVPEGVDHLTSESFSKLKVPVKSLRLPNSLRVIHPMTFNRFDGFTEMRLPVGLEAIKINAFAGSGIRTVYIPPTVKVVDFGAFTGVRTVYYSNRAQRDVLNHSIVPGTVNIRYVEWKVK